MEDDVKLFLASFAFLSISLLGGIGFYTKFIATYRFRGIDVSRVSRFEIIESKNESSPNGGRVVKFQDKEIIKEMLDSLQNCEELSSRDHESFQSSYKIKLILEDEVPNEEFFISVYKKSNRNSGRTNLTPHFSKSQKIYLGDFNCAKFQDLVIENVDPLFQNTDSFAK